MALSIKCPHCGRVIKVSERAAGKRVDCPACKKAFRAPAPAVPIEKPTEPGAPPAAATPVRVWYFHLDGRNDGPHTPETVIEQIKTGRLDAQTLVWKKGMGDWQPLAEVKEFQGALGTPPPVTKAHLRKPHDRGAHDRKGEEHEGRAHYTRDKAKRDLSVGLWVAGGLGFAAVIALLIILSRQGRETRPTFVPPVPPPPVVTQPPEVFPTTAVAPKPKGTPTPPPKRPRVQVSNQKLLTTVVADLDAGFKSAIEGHKKGDAKPILRFIQKLRTDAEKIAERDWGAYKEEVDTLAKRLKEGSNGMMATLKDRSVAWGVGDGIDEKKRAEILELNKYEWITNWQKILSDEVEKVRKRGMEF